MKRPLAIMLFGAFLVWGCTMAIHSRAEDAPTAPEKWKIAIHLTDPEQGEVRLQYGTRETGPVYFATQKECLEAIKADRKFLEILKKVLAFAKSRHAEVDKPECMLDVKLNEI